MEEKKENDLLAEMSVPMAFFRLALPAVAAQLINILYNLVDKMFIGHIPGVGKQALAGVGVTAPVILAVSAFAALVSMGGAPKASIFMGRGDNEQAEKVMGCCTWMLLILSVVLTGIMLIFILPRILSGSAMGVYLAEPIADTIAVCTTAPMFYFYYRKLESGE